MNAPVMLTIAEAAQALRITERTLFDRRKEGSIHSVSLGNRVLISLREIERVTGERPIPLEVNAHDMGEAVG